MCKSGSSVRETFFFLNLFIYFTGNQF